MKLNDFYQENKKIIHYTLYAILGIMVLYAWPVIYETGKDFGYSLFQFLN